MRLTDMGEREPETVSGCKADKEQEPASSQLPHRRAATTGQQELSREAGVSALTKCDVSALTSGQTRPHGSPDCMGRNSDCTREKIPDRHQLSHRL